MKDIIDKFSEQSSTYKRFRPTYPSTIYDEMHLHVQDKKACWDCGTGNGQVASVLAKNFDQVFATDISQNQLNQASSIDNVTYSVQRAERTNFDDNQFDLITVAQAVHWFDQMAFNQEVQRVGKKGAIISIWGYGLLRISDAIDHFIDEFYHNVVGPYWNKERIYIEQAYENIIFDFEEIPLRRTHQIIVQWDVEHLRGFLESWSAVQNYVQHHHDNPVDSLMDSIHAIWNDGALMNVEFPIFVRMGRIS